MIDATALVKAAQGLDPLPATVARLASLVVRPDWSLNEAAHLVEFDAALTGRLLRLANSAAMAGLAPVNTARDAIMRAGTPNSSRAFSRRGRPINPKWFSLLHEDLRARRKRGAAA